MGMARKCCVRNCESDGKEVRYKGLPLHKFPRDPVLRNKWLGNGTFEPHFKPTTGQFVCHRHFTRADYEIIKGHKFILRKGSVPTIFENYDNHPDPLTMPVKSNISYPQEDLDLINSEILNMDNAGSGESSMFAEARTPKSDSCGEACNSRPGSSADSLNPSEMTDATDAGFKSSGENEEPLRSVEIPLDAAEYKLEVGKDEYSVMKTKMGFMEEESKAIKEEFEPTNTTEEKIIVKSDETKPKPNVNCGSLNFNPGDRIEAKDFNDKWYSARVVETDWAEREVLIHFDKSSSRFDEWIPMDSSRLRVLQMQSRETKMRQRDDFDVGERILATWADGRKYPAKVNAVLGNDRYDVLFDDGYAKIVRSSKITKIASSTGKKAMETDSYIGSKQERRDKKRKHTVMELFQTHPRKRSKPEITAVKKDGIVASEDANNYSLDSSLDLDTSAIGTYYDSGAELLRGFENPKPKIRSYTKKIKRDAIKNDTDLEDDIGPEWIDGEPQGVEGFIVDSNEITGTRRSIIVADRRLPPIWQKHFTQRRAGTSAGKWDVLFVHKPSGKKFRSRSDIKTFIESQGCEFDSDMFDFCIHRRKSKNSIARIKHETSGEVPKKIKTILPKTKATPSTPDNSLPLSSTPADSLVPITPTTTPVEDGGTIYSVFIGSLRVEMEDSLFKCPKEGCCKNFRKENLLQMHIKHYHPEYSKFLGSTPNVADLAYARTIGESVIDVTPKKSSNNFLDKINKFEKRKAAHEKQILPGNQMISSPGQTIPLIATSPLPAINSSSDIVGSDKISGTTIRDCNDSKFELMSPVSNASMDVDEESTKKIEANCAMSPGALFDLKIREEKNQIGIKTLLPVRPSVTPTDSSRFDRSKSLDEAVQNEKIKGSRKRQLSEYSTESSKSKGRPSMQELTDDYGDLDDSALDAEGPAGLVYRFSRRKSDAKSDENSQSSQLNDSRLEKADNPKGDASKTDISIETEDGEGVMMMINGEMVKVEQLRREEIINCTCGFMEEDGLMIQCDLCLCWQHGHCNAIEREKDVPEKYICYICRHPYRQRPSMKYLHDQEWLKDGKLPSLTKRTKDQAAINRRTAMLKRSFDLVAALLQIQQILHSLRVKISVAQKKDHPKLYLWAKNWEKSEVKEPMTEPVPVMRIVKKTVETPDSGTETLIEPKAEIPNVVKEDFDEKSIASDTELMKILEEDSTHSEETKVDCKKREAKIPNGEIDASKEKDASPSENENGVATTEMKKDEEIESKDESLTKKSSTNPATSEVTIPMNSAVTEPKQESTTPPQPFVPEPEAPIDPDECRQRLLEHIEHFQNHIDSQLTTIEAQVSVLETMDPDNGALSTDVQRRTKQTMQMLMRDLRTVRKLAALC
ncbi:PHD finger protein 20 isoform X3 [Venturia canescens]|uniref:PHD finger protein 20 isoform X3 n=1 Tax=Venturia canescens TaxID=32260 RepID=UPI001C9D070D|nr:PHD finger protein 20 isoform X3 [Venturia canescens]